MNDKILLNDKEMYEVVLLLANATKADKPQHFNVQHDHWILNIIAEKRDCVKPVVEVALRTVDDTEFLHLDMRACGLSVDERPIIRSFPISCIPALISGLERISVTDIPSFWSAWYTISTYMIA